MEKLNLTSEWDKTFPKSDKVSHSKVTFPTQYGFTLAADLYEPKDIKAGDKLSALAICGPYGAVKEQASGLYAQTLAEKGFITLAFDPSFTGESSGFPRNQTSPDINVEDYSAAVDYLVSRDDIDENKIGILGICGWGGIALSAAASDTRIKATVGSTSAKLSNETGANRDAILPLMNANRTIIAKGGKPQTMFSVPEKIDDSTPKPIKDYYNYYRNPKRGYHPRAINSGLAIPVSNGRGFVTFPMFDFIGEIKSAVLLVHGDAAFTYPVAQDFMKHLKGDNKKLLTVPGASHTDLYDGGEKKCIPFDKIADFYREYLK